MFSLNHTIHSPLLCVNSHVQQSMRLIASSSLSRKIFPIGVLGLVFHFKVLFFRWSVSLVRSCVSGDNFLLNLRDNRWEWNYWGMVFFWLVYFSHLYQKKDLQQVWGMFYSLIRLHISKVGIRLPLTSFKKDVLDLLCIPPLNSI